MLRCEEKALASPGFDMNSLVLRIIPSDSTTLINVAIVAFFLIPPTKIVAALLPDTAPAFSKNFFNAGVTFFPNEERGSAIKIR